MPRDRLSPKLFSADFFTRTSCKSIVNKSEKVTFWSLSFVNFLRLTAYNRRVSKYDYFLSPTLKCSIRTKVFGLKWQFCLLEADLRSRLSESDSDSDSNLSPSLENFTKDSDLSPSLAEIVELASLTLTKKFNFMKLSILILILLE